MHGPEGTDYPNEGRFLEIVRERRVVVEHVSGHHVILALDLAAQGSATRIDWRQTFDTRALRRDRGVPLLQLASRYFSSSWSSVNRVAKRHVGRSQRVAVGHLPIWLNRAH